MLTALAPWLGSRQHPKTLQNAKYDRLILLRHGLPLEGVVMDTLLADYLRDANAKHGLELLAQRNFGFLPTSYSELVPKGADFSAVPIEQAALYCGMDVHVTRRLGTAAARPTGRARPAVAALLDQVELPLEPVLALMEATGIRIDTAYLAELSTELGGTLLRLDAEAKAAAGTDFNLASPKQLGELLFDTLGLDRKKSRKTKTGWSTDAAVLEKLEDAHPVVPLVLEHRTLSKLKSTYVDALPALMEPETGRVHTDFNQAVTATGPPLQQQPQPAEHPGPHGVFAPHPQSLPAGSRLATDQRRLLPDRAAHPGPPLRRRGAGGGLPQRRRRARPHRPPAAGERRGERR